MRQYAWCAFDRWRRTDMFHSPLCPSLSLCSHSHPTQKTRGACCCWLPFLVKQARWCVNLISSYELQRVDSSLVVTREHQGRTHSRSETHRASAFSPSTWHRRRKTILIGWAQVLSVSIGQHKYNVFQRMSFIRLFIHIKSTIYEINVYFREE